MERTSEHLARYDSLENLRDGYLEPIDVENDEYRGWDRFGEPLRLVMGANGIEPIRLATDSGLSLLAVLKRAHELIGSPPEIASGDDLSVLYDRLAAAHEAASARGWISRRYPLWIPTVPGKNA